MAANDIRSSDAGERDAVLVTRVRAGDNEAAVAELVKIHEKKLYRVVMSILINPSDAEEVCQSVLIEALRKLNTLSDGSLFGPWLLRIGRNRAIDALRSRDSRQRRDDQWLNDSTQQRIEADIGQSIDSRIRQMQIEKKLSRLPGLYRSIISLYYWHEMSVDNIAEQLDIPAGTVKSYLFRARKILFTELDRNLL
jgi:RNA polymerase sigma-70 factor (ECF subfamily)